MLSLRRLQPLGLAGVEVVRQADPRVDEVQHQRLAGVAVHFTSFELQNWNCCSAAS